ncbi:MAG TPA: hypothetical protein VG815_13355, partial [Chloroflexota bacterium]|nr:hypothetical protein [Chloroflexota bacterium]
MLRHRVALATSLVTVLSLAGGAGVQARAVHTSTNQANLVADGGFETPVVASCTAAYSGGSALGPWTTVAGGVLQTTSCINQPSEG